MRMRVLFIAVAVAVAAAAPGAAQNIVVNPNFDSGLSGWSSLSYATWDNTLDYGGAPGTHGSLRGTMDPSSGSEAVQCLPVMGMNDYSFGAMTYLGANTDGYVSISWYASGDCSGTALLISESNHDLTTGTWLSLHGANPVTSPVTAQSARLKLMFGNSDTTGGPRSVNFDNVYFGPGTFPVQLQRFSAE